MSNNKHKRKNKKGLTSAIRAVFKKQPDQKLNYKQVSSLLDVSDKNTRKLVLSILNDLKNEGFLNEFQKGAFIINDSYQSAITGTVDATSRGAGYIISDQSEKDIYVAPQHMNRAMHGDTVEVEIIARRKNKVEGKISKIVERKTNLFVGTLDVKKNFAFLLLDNSRVSQDIFVPIEKLNGAKDGQKALVKMTSWPKNVDNPYGEVVEVLGNPGNNDTEMLSILIKNEFEIKFPQEVIEQAESVGIELDPEEIKKRRDFRSTLTFTIDPFDAKDFDDAISYKELDNGNIEVGVHIADVSHYVQPDTPMDKEALKRGNSVYLEDRVIPMLPEQLSNIACSLRPNEDKYTFSAIFEMSREGKITKEWFGKGAIHSDYRFAYEDAQDIIEGKDHILKGEITLLDSIAKRLRKQRMNNGALSISSEEVSFVLNDEGDPIRVVNKVQKDANKLIEEFMLLANRRAATFAGKLPGNKGSDQNFIYRCHDKPDLGKIETFKVFIDKFGYDFTFHDYNDIAKNLNKLFEKVKDTPESGLIQTMAIRSMAKASYETNNIGHYGLSFDFYTHFTSPIRRYADLVVHRIMMDKLNNKNISYGNKLNDVCKHISAQERKAIDAERESNKFFQVKFLQDKVGEIFHGTVSGLADFGMFVKLEENYCEGMIPISSLPGDNYYFDADRFCIIGRQSKKEYNFGDRVEVQVTGVDLFKKQINLEIHEF